MLPESRDGERTTGLHSLLSFPRIYTFLQNSLGARRARRRFVEEFLRMKPEERILDIGCGPGDMYPLLAHCDYLGIDLSPAYIAAARSRFGVESRFRVGDAADLSVAVGKRFDVVLAVALLHHLNDRECASFLATAAKLLEPQGRFVSIDPTVTEPQNPIARFLIARDRGRHVRRPDALASLCSSFFHDVRTAVRTDFLRVPYTHVIVECRRAREPQVVEARVGGRSSSRSPS